MIDHRKQFSKALDRRDLVAAIEASIAYADDSIAYANASMKAIGDATEKIHSLALEAKSKYPLL